MRIIIYLLLTIFSSLLITTSAYTQEISEERLNELVQKEVNRLLNTEGALDEAIERGVERYVRSQRDASDKAKAEQQRSKAKGLRPVDIEHDHIYGKFDAPITLVEYSDFECPFCKRFHPTVVELIKNNQDKVRWVYRHFPLGSHNPGAQKQAEASECVAKLNGNDAFWKYSDYIYKRTKSNGKGFPIENLRPLAEEVGVDGEGFSECLNSGQMAARVKRDIDNGVKIGVSGTPSTFITNQKGEVRAASGALPLENLQAIVEELSL